MLNPASPSQAPESGCIALGIVRKAGTGFWDSESEPLKILVLQNDIRKLQGRGERSRGGGNREGRQTRVPDLRNHLFLLSPCGSLRVPSASVFLSPPQQGRSLRPNLSACLIIHPEPARQAKFMSNAVNPLQTDRLPKERVEPFEWGMLSGFLGHHLPEAAPAIAPFFFLVLLRLFPLFVIYLFTLLVSTIFLDSSS